MISQSIINILPLVSGLASIATAAIVLVAGRNFRSKWPFVLFATAMGVWAVFVSLFLITDSAMHAEMYAQIYYIAAILLSYGFYLFCISFMNSATAARRLSVSSVLIFVPVLILIVSIATPGLFIDSIEIGANNVAFLNHNSYLAYTAIFLIYGLVGLMVLTNAKGQAKLKAKVRQQVVLIGRIMWVCLPSGALFNLILPLFGNYDLIMIGPMFAVPIVFVVFYAIMRHSLFDVRMAAVRTLVYTLTLGVFGLLYFAIAYVLSLVFFQDGTTGNPARIGFANMAIAIVLALLFQPIKDFFDRFTNRVFFHDRYDPGEFITVLGDILTSTTQLRSLLSKSLDHITVTLKASYGAFVVVNEDKAPVVIASDGRKQFSESDVDMLDHLAKTAHRRIVFAHEIPEDRIAMHRVFTKHKIAIVIPLSHAKRTVGFLILGEHKANGYSKRDISLLESITNELIIAIQNARSLQALRDFNVHLQQSIETATKELRQSNSKLRKLDETKDEFVSMASHQLRTPLTSIKGYISMVLDGDVGKITPQQHRLLNEAFVSSERMVRLIGDFLNVSRIQTGKFMIDAKVVDIKTVVAEEVETLQQMAISHGMKLQYIAPSIVPDISIDEDKTRQVIMNFIDNAIYYSPEGTTITVKLKVDSKHVSLEVHDKGIGVPKDKQSQLFTKFFRADNARKQRPDGTGVGLYLAKKVIEEQGGEIIFHSHVGLGSVFGFKLPINRK